MTTKSKPKSATTRKCKTPAELRAQLARDLASIMANPETPTTLYNDIADALTTMSEDIGDEYWHSPEVITQSLNAHLAKEERRKGGKR